MNSGPSRLPDKGNPVPIAATRLDAHQNLDGSVDILIDGRHIEGGDDLPVAEVVGMLGSYAKVHGPLLVTTRLLDGRTTTDRVDKDGSMTPFYPPEEKAPTRREELAHADASVLFRALAQQPPGPVIDPTPVWPENRPQKVYAPRTESKVPTVGEVPMFDVEGDIVRNLEASAPAKSSNGTALRLGVTIGAILAAGALLFLLLPQML